MKKLSIIMTLVIIFTNVMTASASVNLSVEFTDSSGSRIDFSTTEPVKTTFDTDTNVSQASVSYQSSNSVMYKYDDGWRTTQNFNDTKTKNKGHLGIDIVKSANSPIKAVYDGTVVVSKSTASNGNTITIKHTVNGKVFYSFYSHLKSRSVSVGASVKSGQQIGIIGNTGNSSGTHLHLGIYTGSSHMSDPYGYNRNSNGAQASFNSSSGYWDYRGFRFYDPKRFFDTNGSIIPGVNISAVSSDHIPEGHLDGVEGGKGTVKVAGWVFDRDNWSGSIKVHVYIGGPTVDLNAEVFEITANKPRADVQRVHNTPAQNYGFEDVLSTSKRGWQDVYVYAINHSQSPDPHNPQIGHARVFIEEAASQNTKQDVVLSIWHATIGDGRTVDEAWDSEPSVVYIGQTVYHWYKLSYQNSGQLMQGGNYTAKMSVYYPNGALLYSHEYKNSNNNWVRFVPQQPGSYRCTVEISGDFNGIHSYNINVKAKEDTYKISKGTLYGSARYVDGDWAGWLDSTSGVSYNIDSTASGYAKLIITYKTGERRGGIITVNKEKFFLEFPGDGGRWGTQTIEIDVYLLAGRNNIYISGGHPLSRYGPDIKSIAIR